MKLSLLPSPHIPQARALYESSFPECERRPTAGWLKMIGNHIYFKAWEVADAENAFCGLITAWDFASFTYVEHFATIPSLWGKGAGGEALDLFIKKHAGKPVVLEVEPPLSDLPRRRVGFYKRHGFSLIPLPYSQPPYRPGADWIALCVMATRPHFAKRHFEAIRKTIHREVYGVEEQELHFLTKRTAAQAKPVRA